MTAEQVSQPCWVAAVIRDDKDQVLLVRSSEDQAWDLPAGTIGRGEDVIAAVRRIVAGTATIGVSVGWMTGVHSHVHDGLTLVFLARHAAGRVAPAGVIQTCCWATPDEASRLLWPTRAEQLVGALHARQPQPVTVVQHVAPRRSTLRNPEADRPAIPPVASVHPLAPAHHSLPPVTR